MQLNDACDPGAAIIYLTSAEARHLAERLIIAANEWDEDEKDKRRLAIFPFGTPTFVVYITHNGQER